MIDENVQKELMEEINKLPYLKELLPIVEIEAARNGLQIFIFNKEDLKDDFEFKFDNLVVVTISKDPHSALWNVKNHRHSYLAKEDIEEKEV